MLLHFLIPTYVLPLCTDSKTMNKKPVYLLAIESSCDDTSCAVMCDRRKLSLTTAGQSVHQAYGGVVPELASRAHQQHIVPVVHQAIAQANIDKKDLSAIAFTRGPGLLGSLLVGTSFAKSLALGWDIPLIEVNHLQGHVLAHFIEDHNPRAVPEFPFLAVTISGGHTQIIEVRSPFDFKVIGQTLDDAIGEAFDKSAKILGFDYPGGPLIDQWAQTGHPYAYTFPIPKVSGLDFSFSGLKTSILYFIQEQTAKNQNFIAENRADLCASIQHTIVTILMKKIHAAVLQTGITQVAIGGGVSANSGVRKALIDQGDEAGWTTFIPPFEYCTDNAAMIGIVGYFKYLEGQFSAHNISAQARYPI